jgi:hypothetical protein
MTRDAAIGGTPPDKKNGAIFFNSIDNNSWRIKLFLYIFTHFKIAQFIT